MVVRQNSAVLASGQTVSEKIVQLPWRERFLLWLDWRIAWLLEYRWIRDFLQKLMLIIGWSAAFIFFRFLSRSKIIGRENLLHTTKQMLVSNHESLLDSFFIGIALLGFWEAVFHPERIPWNTPDAVNFLSRPVFGRIFQLLKTIPVTRDKTKVGAVRRMLADFKKALEDSNLVLFFEGTRSRDGQIGQCQDGVASTIIQAKPIVVPILLQGMRNVMPVNDGNRKRDFSWLNIHLGQRVWIVIGKPIDYSAILSGNGDHRQEIKDLVRKSVIELQDQLPKGVLATPLS